MVATVRLDDHLEDTLSRVSKLLNKKKSEVIREAIQFYTATIEKKQKSRILNAVEKTKNIDKKDFLEFEGMVDDGI